MGNLFDDFLDELRRRQAEAAGEDPDGPRPVGPNGPHDPDDPDDPDDPEEGEPRRRPDDREAARRRRPRRAAPGGPQNVRRIVVMWALVIGLLAVLIFGRGLITVWTDVIWYQSVGYVDVLWTRLGAQVGLFALGLVAGVVFVVVNLVLAIRLGRAPTDGSGGVLGDWIARFEEVARTAERGAGGRPPWDPTGQTRRAPSTVTDEIPDLVPMGRWAVLGLGLLAALGVAGTLAANWETILLWQNRVPFSPEGTPVVDPIFGRDIAFYFFELPLQRLLQSMVVDLAFAGLVIAGGLYLLMALSRGLVLSTAVRVHLGVLGGAWLLAIAFGYQLQKLELVYSQRGVGTGVSYTDATAQFVAFDVLAVLSALAAAFLVGGAFTRWVRPLGLTVGIWFVASVVVGGLYPEAVQRFTVDPNEYALERPYITNNIQMTRLAFAFDQPGGGVAWDDTRLYQGDAPFEASLIDSESTTFQNARLWDYRPLGSSLNQLQVIRRYYDFYDVDTDRYVIDGVQRQVMLSARELDLGGTDARGFVSQRIIYTHGIGLAMVPVNEVTGEGQPRLLIRDLPPVSSGGAPPIEEPRIYFGERPSDYIIVNARQNEFDFPRGDADPGSTDSGGAETRWRGSGGIRLDTTFSRLLFSIRFGDLDLLITDQVTDQSQLLFHRSLGDRVPLIAPFLRYDKDPYVVIGDDGRLVYVWDAYTISDRFPNAESFDPGELSQPGQPSGLAGAPFNYLRNSVKVVVDAYTGTMSFYVADPTDPLIRAWQGVFPQVFQPMTDLPADLVGHLRVPEERFNVQTRVFARYHVLDPLKFYNGEDVWMVPAGRATEQSLAAEAYYVVMRMPGESAAEFLLLQPMVPINRPNMIAWVAARNDAPNYGDVRVYRFPTNTSVFGPVQIEARIDQDPVISSQITLWNQSGSSVVRGNLIVVPVGESLLYLQPVYLQSTASSFPEFQRIIVATATQVVWAPTLGEALQDLLEAQGGPSPSPTPSPSAGPTPTPSPTGGPTATPPPGEDLPTDVPGLIDYANRHFELAQAALRDGQFAVYGEEIERVRQALARLDELGGPTPSPAPRVP